MGNWIASDVNFQPAWVRLCKLYNDPYGTSQELCQQLKTMEKMTEENGHKLQIISNTIQEVVRQLEALGRPVHDDAMYIHLVQAKLDPKTSMDWDSHREGNDNPTLNDFTDFLDRRAKALCSAYRFERLQESEVAKNRKRSHSSKSHHSNNKRFKPNIPHNTNHAMANHHASGSNYSKPDHTAVKSENQNCAMCGLDHLTRKCDKFLKLSLTKRKEKAREENLCFLCLGRAHTVRECSWSDCNRCHKRHGALLCPENPNNRALNAAPVAAKKKFRLNKKHQSKRD